MNSYININKVFTSEESRTVPSLKEVYFKLDVLRELITDITKPYLNENTLKNKRVLLKPNWVNHSKIPTDDLCLRTHNNFILAALEVILKCMPAEVTIGDAPIQGCSWVKLLNTSFLDEVKDLSMKYNIPVGLRDFRRSLFDSYSNRINKEQHPVSDYSIFNLGQKSCLEPISAINDSRFRVIHYNPDGFRYTHVKGVHKYFFTKAIFESDVIISLPKIKTHQYTCITGALKNIVGLNGDKDFLPHHRLGGTDQGGDCYAGKNILKYMAELSQDAANRHHGSRMFRIWLKISGLLWKLSFPKESDNLGAGWYGNDTAWRMVVDLNKIILYGKPDGSIADEKQRTLYSLCDAIIGGEGNGPLRPEPFPLGMISFSNDSELTDLCFGRLMNLNEELIPLLRSARENLEKRVYRIKLNDLESSFDQLREYALSPKLPRGWKNYQKCL